MKKIKITEEQYNKLIINHLLKEEPIVKGGINRVDRNFVKSINSANIKDLDQNTDFNIKKQLPNVSGTAMKKSKEIKINEDIFSSELHQAIHKFIENIWLNPSQKGLDRFFIENGITWGDIISYLTSVGVLAAFGAGIYKVKNIFKTRFSNDEDEAMEQKMDTIEKITKMVEKDPDAPWNQETTYEKKQRLQAKPDSDWEAKPKPFRPFKAGLGETEEDEYRSDYYKELGKRGKEPEPVRSSSPQVFKPIYMNYDILLAKGPDGMYVFYYSDIDRESMPNPEFELDIDDVADYLNDNYSQLKTGEGVEGWEGGTADLIKLDDELKTLLSSLYSKDRGLIQTLERLSEMTSAASSGSFTGPMGGGLSKGAISPGYTPAKEMDKIINDEDKIYGSKIEEDITVDEVTTASSSGSYVQPAIWAKDEKNWAGNKRTQYPKGQFVTFDPCTKLNNNKEAQKGKCSQGAVDNVVKLRTTKDSVISKNIYEIIANETGKTVTEVKNIIEKRIK